MSDECNQTVCRTCLRPFRDTEAIAKDLAINLAVRELEKLTPETATQLTGDPAMWRRHLADAIIANLLIGLGCEAVVKAWDQCS